MEIGHQDQRIAASLMKAHVLRDSDKADIECERSSGPAGSFLQEASLASSTVRHVQDAQEKDHDS